MDLSTEYLGLKLPHPLIPGASPIVDNLDFAKRFEDAGAAAIVMHSLFEEQITGERHHAPLSVERAAQSGADSCFPDREIFPLGPDQYLDQVRRLKEALRIPVIASLNGTTLGDWLEYARLIEEAGADALEINLYRPVTDPAESAREVEDRQIGIVQHLKESIRIPLAVKLSPFYTSLPNFASGLCKAGADGLVLFNRFYQPDINLENLEAAGKLALSHSGELLLRLRWTAILHGRVPASLAVSGGVHSAEDAVKAVMVGASAVQMVSALLQGGPDYLEIVRNDLRDWLEEHGYGSLRQIQGSLNLRRCPNPETHERANYVKLLQGWEDPRGRI